MIPHKEAPLDRSTGPIEKSCNQFKYKEPVSNFNRFCKQLILITVFLVVAINSGCSDQTGPKATPTSMGIQGPDLPDSAVIVDQLSISYPNPGFAEKATEILEKGGYRVVYVPGEEVTVEFFRYLPTQNYKIIILRAHSSTLSLDENGNLDHEDFTSISTGEPASDKYKKERNTDRLGGFMIEEDDKIRFTIRPGFIDQDMVGNFNGALIVMMGCDGMKALGTADSFLERGAGAIVGWNGEVSVAHTDRATEFLLNQYAVDGKSIVDAVKDTRTTIGEDPIYNVNMAVWTNVETNP